MGVCTGFFRISFTILCLNSAWRSRLATQSVQSRQTTQACHDQDKVSSCKKSRRVESSFTQHQNLALEITGSLYCAYADVNLFILEPWSPYAAFTNLNNHDRSSGVRSLPSEHHFPKYKTICVFLRVPSFDLSTWKAWPLSRKGRSPRSKFGTIQAVGCRMCRTRTLSCFSWAKPSVNMSDVLISRCTSFIHSTPWLACSRLFSMYFYLNGAA